MTARTTGSVALGRSSTVGLLALLALGMAASRPETHAATPAAVQLLPNGDFEQGAVVWSQSSTHRLTLIRRLSEINVTARSGQWGAVLGIADSEVASIEQTVTVPGNAQEIVYWYQLGSLDSHLGFDWARIVVNGWDVLDEFQLMASGNVTVWTRRSADIRAYAGQTVALRIELSNDIADASTLLVDDVHFETGGVSTHLFSDGFESGNTANWSLSVP